MVDGGQGIRYLFLTENQGREKSLVDFKKSASYYLTSSFGLFWCRYTPGKFVFTTYSKVDLRRDRNV